jgi:hypothetical protein
MDSKNVIEPKSNPSRVLKNTPSTRSRRQTLLDSTQYKIKDMFEMKAMEITNLGENT